MSLIKNFVFFCLILPIISTLGFHLAWKGKLYQKRSHLITTMNMNDNKDQSKTFRNIYFSSLSIIPASSTAISFLLTKITDLSISSMDRQYYIIGLLLFKRIYLYSIAAIAFYIASLISSESPSALGEVRSSISIT